jgi:hypothetical protein
MASKLRLMILIMLVLIVALLFYQLLSTLKSEPSSEYLAKHYLFNEEIRAFPLEETSVTFTAWKILRSSAEQTNELVRINYTVRNISDKLLDLTSFSMFGEAPILDYGNNYYTTSFYEMDNFWEFYGATPSHLMPNEVATNGILQYEIIKGASPEHLLYPDELSPLVIIDFA